MAEKVGKDYKRGGVFVALFLFSLSTLPSWGADKPSSVTRKCIYLLEAVEKFINGPTRYRGIGSGWWKDSEIEAVQEEGLYAPIVYSLAQRQKIPTSMAYAQLKYLETAPIELKWLIMAEEKYAYGDGRVGISTTSRKYVAKRFMDNDNERSVIFRLKIPFEKQVLPVSLNASDYARTLRLALRNSVEWLEAKARNSFPLFRRQLQRAILVRKWLEANEWGKDFFYGSSDPTPERVRDFWKFRTDASSLSYPGNLLDQYIPWFGEAEFISFLRIPPEQIQSVDVYENGKLVETRSFRKALGLP